MAIEFRCPNGHRLSCPDDRAGKPAKCPKCNATFTVPMPDAVAAGAVGEASVAAVADSGAISSIGKGNTEAVPEEGSAPRNDSIVFLCPNGHKLNCPPNMQGKPGKCPHCGAKFLIPQYSDEEAVEDEHGSEEDEESEAEPDIDLEMTDESEESEAEDPPVPSPPELPFDFSAGFGGRAEPEAAPRNVLPEIFNELWMHHDQSLVIEVQLRSGGTITPHHFSPLSIQAGYAIFAVKEPHGAYTLSVVVWDQIERITVRGMSELPHEYFP